MAIVATEQDPEHPTSSSPACAVPNGTAHALDPGETRTRCGTSASKLMQWPEFTWPPSGMASAETCPECAVLFASNR